MVADEHFIIRIPDTLPLDAAAPLLCAGITVYSPLRYFQLDKPGFHIGVVGLGGLGHMAVKFAKAMGAKVTVISTSPNKKKEALENLGRKTVAGSGVGGIEETQEMMNFAAKYDLKPDIEVIPVDYVNTAMERLVKGDVKYRFVIDIGNTLKATSS
ncbi:Alcohol dehydrogenase superfamily, zinc-type [Corchorus olitorius]|uniref:cinnamyl-alcohol dehydrogenase n=1 Tax=Corchorus olitorius TaxID=93759 RepID=A0A1R3K3H8_9ROSI|nr:Alcohol dehydrogenase superfamily, zinc-type [Corchorus olitorius]